jgi:hypothetical protein
MSIAKWFIARSRVVLLVVALQFALFMLPGIAFARPMQTRAGSAPIYSVSHYVSFSSGNATNGSLKTWAIRDAQVEDPAGDNSSCAPNYYSRSIVAVLDFGQPAPTGGVYGVRNWLFVTYTYSQIEGFVETYASQWYLHAGVCAHLTVAIGENNSNECLNPSNSTCIYNEGHGLAASVNDVQNWIAGLTKSNATYNDFALQVAVIGGDDIENGETDFDTYNQTKNFIQGFSDFNSQNHTSYNLLDYGDAIPCGDFQSTTSACGSGNTDEWTYGEIYNAAWGLGWDEALPEVYNQSLDQQWAAVYDHTQNGCADCVGQGALQFSGVMDDDGSTAQATLFWNTVGNRGRGAATDWNTCMPGLSTSEAGGSSPCD